MSFAKVLDAPQHPVLAILGGISKSYKLKTPGLIRLFAYHVFHIMHLVYIAYYIYIYIYILRRCSTHRSIRCSQSSEVFTFIFILCIPYSVLVYVVY